MTHGHHHHHGGGHHHGSGGHHHHHHHGGNHHHGHHHHHHHHGGQASPGIAVAYYLPATTVRAPLLEPMPHSSGSDNGFYKCLAFLILAVVLILFYIFLWK